MLHVHADAVRPCQCCMSIAMLCVHCPYRCGSMSMLRVIYPCCTSVKYICPFCIPMMYVHAACACCKYMLHNYAASPCCIPMQIDHSACPCCIPIPRPRFLSIMPVRFARPLCKPMLYAMLHVHDPCLCLHTECTCCFSMLLFHAACPTVCPWCINMLHFLAVYPCSMSMQHVYAACQCFMAMSPHCSTDLRLDTSKKGLKQVYTSTQEI